MLQAIPNNVSFGRLLLCASRALCEGDCSLGRLQQRMPSSSRPLGVRRSPYIYMPTIHDGVLDAPFARTSSLPQSPANNVASCVLCWMPVYQTHVAMQLFLMSCALSEIEIVDLQNSGGILGCYTMQILDGSKETGRTTPQCQSVCVCVWNSCP